MGNKNKIKKYMYVYMAIKRKNAHGLGSTLAAFGHSTTLAFSVFFVFIHA